jgi:DNA-binding CsgD family transcriptional regulator
MTRKLVGRDAERERLDALLAAVRAGKGQVLVVSGPPGIGKSALLDELERSAAGLRVLRATGVQAERELAFGALQSLLLDVLDLRDRLPAVQAQALERAFALAAGEAADRFAIAAGVLSLLAAAAGDTGVLCIADDVQWFDEPSLAALAFAARRLRSEGVGVVLAEREAGKPSAALAGLPRLALDPLDEPAARELLRAEGPAIPGETAAEIVAGAEGNPLALLELAARLSPHVRMGRAALLGPPPPHADAEQLLGQRVAALAPATRAALLIAAAAERSDTAFLAGALRAAGLALPDLVEAERQGLVRLHADSIALGHPLVRSVAYHAADPGDRRRAHAAVAAALTPGDRRRPWHLAAAALEPDEAVAVALDEGANDARRRGGYASAARALQRAAELTPDGDDRARRLADSAHDFEMAGHAAEAEAMLAAAARSATDPAIAARIRGLQAHQLSREHPAEARPLLLAEAEALTAAIPLSAARYLLEAGWAGMLLGDLDGWLEPSRRALELLEGREGSTRRVARAQYAAALITAGRADAAEPLVDAVLQSLAPPGPLATEPIAGAVEVHASLCESLTWLERWDAAERLSARLVDSAHATGAAGVLPYVLCVRAALDLRLGRWTAAGAALHEAVALADATGQASFLGGAIGLRAVAGALRGESSAPADAHRALELSEHAAPSLAIHGHAALGSLAVARGELAEAVARFTTAGEIDERARFAEPARRTWEPDLIETLIRSGDEAAAVARLERWERDGARLGRRFVLATAARCRALLAADDELDAAFGVAIAAHDGLPMPYERARTLLAYGERLRRARRRTDARAPLREALELFEALPSDRWARQARRELRATGGMVPAARPHELAELTPHEVQVALMVAEGRTNREVAAALFLSPKTVEHHLSAIYRKLGIARRTELARAFAGELADAG